MKFLVTRPLDDAKQTARHLHDAGHSALIAPLMQIREEAGIREEDLNLDDIGGLVLTSANGLRAFCDISKRRDLPVYAVGDTSATLAREAGFETVLSAAGDTNDLAALIGREYQDKSKPLLHVAGKVVAGDLVDLLDAQGVSLHRKTMYHADLIDEFPIDIIAAFTHKQIDGVLIYSPRTGRHFADLVEKSALQGELAGITVYCLSPAVAETVSGLEWKRVATAAEPNEKALFALFGEDEPVMSDEDKDKVEATKDEAATPEKPVESKPSSVIEAAKPAPVETKKPAAAKEEAKPAAKPYSPPPPRTETVTIKRGPNVLITLAIGVLGGAAASFAIPLLTPMIKEYVPQAAPWLPKETVARDDLTQAITEMNKRVAAARQQGTADINQALERVDGQLLGLRSLEDAQQGLTDKVDALPALLDALSARLEAIENKEDPDYQAAMALVQAMEARMRQVEATAAKAEAISVTRISDQMQPYVAEMRKLALDVDGMENSVATIGSDARYGDRKAAVALAIGQLRRVIERGGRIDTELLALRHLLSGLPGADAAHFDQDMRVLAAYGMDAVPGQTGLIDLFDKVETRFGQEVAEGSDSWVTSLAGHFDSLVKVRRVSADGSALGDGELRFAKAYEAMRNGDLDTALELVTDQDRDYTTWRAATVQRRNALAAVDGLEAAARQLLVSQSVTGGAQ